MSDPSYAGTLGLGFLLGLRHALDADHVAAVSTVLVERPSLRASSSVGLWWGIGHTVTLLVVGAIVLALGVRIPEEVEFLLESGVGFLLVGLGGHVAFKLYRDRWHVHFHTHDDDLHVHLHSHRRHIDHCHGHQAATSLRPFCIGMVHGLAGSAAVMLVILASTRELGAGLLSIVTFGVGSIVGMMAIGMTISLPLIWSFSISRRLFVWVQGLAGVASVCVGLWMLVKQAQAAGGP